MATASAWSRGAPILLSELAGQLPTPSFVKSIDVAKADQARRQLRELIDEMSDVELFVLNAGIGFVNPQLDWERERDTIDVNVSGFAATANVAVEHLLERGSGQIVGISSIAALRGNRAAPPTTPQRRSSRTTWNHCAIVSAKGICRSSSPTFSPDSLIPPWPRARAYSGPRHRRRPRAKSLRAIAKRKEHAYVTKRWRVIAWVLKAAPNWLYHRF